MTNLPVDLRRRLAEGFSMAPASVRETLGAPGDTRKVLLELRDAECVEEVLIPGGGPRGKTRRTVCISTQVGCRFHCAFCASGQGGFRRNLEAGEIVGQVLIAGNLFGEPPTHVVFMGIGEPLDNVDAVLKAVSIINDPDGLRIGARRITISTCGLVPGMERLAEEGIQVELSVSLHAPDDALRSTLMPANRTYPLALLVEACRAYTGKTGRIVTFEYTLIDGVNDSPGQARDLAALIGGFPCRVNLIPLSAVPEYEGRPPAAETAGRFAEMLEGAGINTTLRMSRGSSIEAACGQLRLRREQ